MSHCPETQIRKILIEVPPILFTRFNIPEKFIEENKNDYSNATGTYNKWLKIHLLPNEYVRIVEGQRSEYVDSFSTYYFSPNLARVGFQVRTRIAEYQVKALLQYIGEISTSTGYKKHKPIRIHDYVRPEPKDFLNEAIEDPWSERIGLLYVNPDGGTVGFNKTLYSDELSFDFKSLGKTLHI